MTRTLEIALVSMMVLAVLSFGGTEPVSFAVVEGVIFAALIVLLASNGSRALPRSRSLLVPAVLAGVVLLQVVSLPGLGRAALSIAPGESSSRFLVLLACLSAFLITLALGGHSGARRRIVYALLAIGGFEALYGLIHYLTSSQHILFYARDYPQNAAAGTYINENHYAGLLEMLLPLSLAVCLSQLEFLGEPGKQAAAGVRRWLARAELPKFLFWLAASAVLLLALIFSYSRMGILAAICSLLWIFGAAATLWLPRRTSLALAVLFCVAGGWLVVWVGPGPVIKRFGTLPQEAALNGESRLAIWRDTASLIRRHPWLGTGLGTFPVAYTSVQTAFLSKFVNHAHNDYLELASDLGIPAAAVVFAAILYLPVRALRSLRQVRRPFDRAILLGSAGSIVAILLHSLADFNLYVPANTMVLCVIVGLALSIRPLDAEIAGAVA